MIAKKSPKRLAAYKAKRNFKKTPEPSGTPSRKKPSRTLTRFFCVQKHLASRLHYDFRLEHRGVLLSWAVPKGPSLDPHNKRLAVNVEDHPLDYGNFEGVIPSGYGAGVVVLWDVGTWQPEDPDLDAALLAGRLKFKLDGTKLKGIWNLIRIPNQEKNWLLIKHPDEWSGALDILEFAPASVKSGDDLGAVLKKHPDAFESLSELHRNGEAGELLNALLQEAKLPTPRKKLSKSKGP